MTQFILRVAGVNFGATLYDTNDLSVIRGASLMLDGVVDAVKNVLKDEGFASAVRLSGGASVAEFALRTDAVGASQAEAALRRALASGPWRHLSFVIGVKEVSGDRSAAQKAAEARCASSQFRQWTVPPCPAPHATRQDALDGVRGASKRLHLKGWVSEATRTRLREGRFQRQRFFLSRLGDKLEGVRFCNSFDELIANAPKWVPDAASRKIAVIHFDGDGFGAAARNVGVERFAEEMAPLSKALLGRLVDDARKAEEREVPDKALRLRLEVLVWGGDDITLVAPAWRALDLLAGFFEQTESWQVGGVELGFTGGCVIAPFKSPIRQLTRLAAEAVDLGKEAAARGSFTIDVFESAAPPENGLAAHRSSAFDGGTTAQSLAFPGADAGKLLKAMRDWREQAGDKQPSRGKVIGWLTDMAEMAPDAADEYLEEGLADERARLPGRDAQKVDWLRLPARPAVVRPLALDLRLAMELWDYAVSAPTAEDPA